MVIASGISTKKPMKRYTEMIDIESLLIGCAQTEKSHGRETSKRLFLSTRGREEDAAVGSRGEMAEERKTAAAVCAFAKSFQIR